MSMTMLAQTDSSLSPSTVATLFAANGVRVVQCALHKTVGRWSVFIVTFFTVETASRVLLARAVFQKRGIQIHTYESLSTLLQALYAEAGDQHASSPSVFETAPVAVDTNSSTSSSTKFNNSAPQSTPFTLGTSLGVSIIPTALTKPPVAPSTPPGLPPPGLTLQQQPALPQQQQQQQLSQPPLLQTQLPSLPMLSLALSPSIIAATAASAAATAAAATAHQHQKPPSVLSSTLPYLSTPAPPAPIVAPSLSSSSSLTAVAASIAATPLGPTTPPRLASAAAATATATASVAPVTLASTLSDLIRPKSELLSWNRVTTVVYQTSNINETASSVLAMLERENLRCVRCEQFARLASKGFLLFLIEFASISIRVRAMMLHDGRMEALLLDESDKLVTKLWTLQSPSQSSSSLNNNNNNDNVVSTPQQQTTTQQPASSSSKSTTTATATTTTASKANVVAKPTPQEVIEALKFAEGYVKKFDCNGCWIDRIGASLGSNSVPLNVEAWRENCRKLVRDGTLGQLVLMKNQPNRSTWMVRHATKIPPSNDATQTETDDKPNVVEENQTQSQPVKLSKRKNAELSAAEARATTTNESNESRGGKVLNIVFKKKLTTATAQPTATTTSTDSNTTNRLSVASASTSVARQISLIASTRCVVVDALEQAVESAAFLSASNVLSISCLGFRTEPNGETTLRYVLVGATLPRLVAFPHAVHSQQQQQQQQSSSSSSQQQQQQPTNQIRQSPVRQQQSPRHQQQSPRHQQQQQSVQAPTQIQKQEPQSQPDATQASSATQPSSAASSTSSSSLQEVSQSVKDSVVESSSVVATNDDDDSATFEQVVEKASIDQQQQQQQQKTEPQPLEIVSTELIEAKTIDEREKANDEQSKQLLSDAQLNEPNLDQEKKQQHSVDDLSSGVVDAKSESSQTSSIDTNVVDAAVVSSGGNGDDAVQSSDVEQQSSSKLQELAADNNNDDDNNNNVVDVVIDSVSSESSSSSSTTSAVAIQSNTNEIQQQQPTTPPAQQQQQQQTTTTTTVSSSSSSPSDSTALEGRVYAFDLQSSSIATRTLINLQLGAMLQSPYVTKVIHDARSQLAILCRQLRLDLQLVRNVFDTQVVFQLLCDTNVIRKTFDVRASLNDLLRSFQLPASKLTLSIDDKRWLDANPFDHLEFAADDVRTIWLLRNYLLSAMHEGIVKWSLNYVRSDLNNVNFNECNWLSLLFFGDEKTRN